MNCSRRRRSRGNCSPPFSPLSSSSSHLRLCGAKSSRSQSKVLSSAAARGASKIATGASTRCSHHAQKASTWERHGPAMPAWPPRKRAAGLASQPASPEGTKRMASSASAPSSHGRPAQRQSSSPLRSPGPRAKARARRCRARQSKDQSSWRAPSASGARKKPTKVPPAAPPVAAPPQAAMSPGERSCGGAAACACFANARMFAWSSCPPKACWSRGARTRVSGKSRTRGVRQAR
mmetsp:Transcript_64664/g.181960  ORF Transcript_64664/g.181960 Transcript_64664/m.181960 type:complete len:235 (-) Transcript_64664:427-1131(-)